MKTQRDPEPSMDEILASIRQIISGDYQKEDQNLENNDPGEILDLMNPLPDEGGNSKNFDKNYETLFVVDEKNVKTQTHETQDRFHSNDEDPLLSAVALAETAQSFKDLHTCVQKSSQLSGSSLKGTGEKTLESLTREVLKPLLKEWLDTNLPTIVRWVVNEQVERLVSQMAYQDLSREKEESSF